MMFFVVILTGYLVYITTWIMFGEKLAAVYPQGLLMDIVKKVNLVLFLRLLILTPLVILTGLVVSNRVAGPIYHINKYLKRVIAGDYSTCLRLRKKDELQDLAMEINSLVDKLRKDRAERAYACEELKKIVLGVKEASAREKKGIDEKLEVLVEKIKLLENKT
jgi:signal transduction histidine kinase